MASQEQQALYIKAVNDIAEVPSQAWDACANPGGDIPDNPFLYHAFFSALEKSGSAVPARGWQPFHLTMETSQGELLGVVPMYLKGHSRGEYVFDGSWADALERAGGRYYPKLQASVPFTPATGRRLLARPGPHQEAMEAQLAAGCVEVAKQLEVSSLHFTFLTEPQWSRLGELGLLKRMDRQFHWHNKGYASFDEFLGDLSSKKRKNIRRERRDAFANDIEIEWVTGSELTEHHWDAFYQFYTDTGSRKWGVPYLTRQFFSLVGESIPNNILLILCRRGGKYIAGAINFIGSDTLFGRNWGCLEDHPFLHFEACYYQAIDFAIARGLKRVEAGAQGGHKLSRGYLPEATYSAHWIHDAGFRRVVDSYLKDERHYVQEDIDYIDTRAPFRKDMDLASVRPFDRRRLG